MADAEAIPFLDEQFDLVMANHMLYHVDIPRALSEAERVLKPAGTFLAMTNSQHGMPALATLHMQTMNHLGIKYHAEVNEPFSLENGEEQLQRGNGASSEAGQFIPAMNDTRAKDDEKEESSSYSSRFFCLDKGTH